MDAAVETITPERDAAPQWRSTGGKLLIQRCEECGDAFHYPRVVCPYCLSDRLAWVECAGTGRIYSFSVMRRGDPYAIAFVELDEGPRLMTNIVDCDLDAIEVEQKVQVTFRDVDGIATPMFRPLEA
ncbi:Zn-ribbon domain-containing OB-fold protein [Kumtagia ephedrae]|uniref:DNA-binding protein n=1 Tax=Kumtagia ephedrae TaxID=2116701 RepID=A0A2P7SRW3_9HYPH|nr:OB-fold domain-containing protein [Mesorhizobium ephedrae]PSJ65223.1 DNA-binding protein [Mesorhizobium ephedrae]